MGYCYARNSLSLTQGIAVSVPFFHTVSGKINYYYHHPQRIIHFISLYSFFFLFALLIHLRLATLSLSVKINPSRSPHDKVTLRDKKDDPTSFFVVVVVRLLLLNLNVIASIVIITVITAVPCRVIAMLLEFYIPVICIMKYDILRIPIRIKPSCDARLQCTPLKTLL